MDKIYVMLLTYYAMLCLTCYAICYALPLLSLGDLLHHSFLFQNRIGADVSFICSVIWLHLFDKLNIKGVIFTKHALLPVVRGCSGMTMNHTILSLIFHHLMNFPSNYCH